MCRSIHTLYNYEPPTTEDEVRAAAIQYVRKISGFSKPSRANEEAFARAVDAVAAASTRLLDELVTSAAPRDRERGVDRAIVVCAPLHLFRTRFFFRRLYGRFGIDTTFRAARVAPTPHALAWELLALPVRKAQLRAAEDELAR